MTTATTVPTTCAPGQHHFENGACLKCPARITAGPVSLAIDCNDPRRVAVRTLEKRLRLARIGADHGIGTIRRELRAARAALKGGR